MVVKKCVFRVQEQLGDQGAGSDLEYGNCGWCGSPVKWIRISTQNMHGHSYQCRDERSNDGSRWTGPSPTTVSHPHAHRSCGVAIPRQTDFTELAWPTAMIIHPISLTLFWRYTGPTQPLQLLHKDVYGIGLFVSTKAVGEWERQDITSSYKFAEKTEDERTTMFKALQQTDSVYSRYYLNEDCNDVSFHFHLLDDIVIGQDFTVTLEIRNKVADKTHTVTGALNVDSVRYTGDNRVAIKSKHFEVEVQAMSVQTVRVQVEFEEYSRRLQPQSAFNISCMAKVRDTDYDYFAGDDFRVRKPDIKIRFQGTKEVVSREPIEVVVTLKNPLPVALRKGVMHVEGPGLEKALEFKVAEVPVGGDALVAFEFVPPYSGRGTFVAKFFSKELDDVDGFLAFEMQPRPEDILTPNWNRDYNNVIARTDVIA